MPTTSHSHFMRLPVEVRLRIYAYGFHRCELSDGPHGLALHGDLKSSAHMLCKVNRRVRAEAIPVLAKQTKVLTVDATHLRAPSVAPGMGSYAPRLSYEWFMNIEVLAFGCKIKLLPEVTRFPTLKAVVVMESVIWGMRYCALPTKSTILEYAKSDHLSTSNNWVRPIFLESNRTFKVWTRVVFVELDEVTSDLERFTELVALRELLASVL